MAELLGKWARNVYTYLMNMTKEDIKWEEFEAEINAQVNAVFTVAEEMDAFTNADGISKEYKMSDATNIFSCYKTIDELNEKMSKRRSEQRRGRFPKLFFLLIFIISLLTANFLVPRSFGGRKVFGFVNETFSLASEFIALLRENGEGGGAPP